jgi:hypothetical protein
LYLPGIALWDFGGENYPVFSWMLATCSLLSHRATPPAQTYPICFNSSEALELNMGQALNLQACFILPALQESNCHPSKRVGVTCLRSRHQVPSIS